MKRNLMLGKFMDRNKLVIITYAVSMFLSVVMPGFFSTYLHVTTPSNIEIGLMALLTTIFWGYLNYQQTQDRLFKDLFKEFNERYDAFNDDYQYFKETYLEEVKMEDVQAVDVKKIIDYLNLCAEEYFWFEKGRIEQTAWESWKSGMQTWAQLPAVRIVFMNEVSTWTTSYYKGFLEFFKSL